MSKTILIIDDEKTARWVLRELLQEMDASYEIKLLPGAVEAQEFIKVNPFPALIILDWMMPHISGLEFLEQLKSDKNTENIPVIVATAKYSDTIMKQAFEAGAIDFVEKPINRLELQVRVASALKLAESFQKIQDQNAKIQSINEKLNAQKQAIAVQARRVEQSNKNFVHQNRKLKSSITYAKRIQDAMLNKQDRIRVVFPNSFILFKPRDVVSGDFYWFTETTDETKNAGEGGKIIIAAVDCTGHGIPGAFMSLIGNTLLNQLVYEKQIRRPDVLLNELHTGIVKSLKQEETNNTDGMDIALCMIDKSRPVLEFAGAKNSLLYIQDNTMHEVKGDVFSIGGLRQEGSRSFTRHTVDISKPTCFYLYSDGYTDQFGGERGLKFMNRNFKELLFKIYKHPMHEQHRILNETLMRWQDKKYKQIDDILVIGVKI